MKDTTSGQHALKGGERNGEIVALNGLKAQAQRFQAIGRQFSARGY